MYIRTWAISAEQRPKRATILEQAASHAPTQPAIFNRFVRPARIRIQHSRSTRRSPSVATRKQRAAIEGPKSHQASLWPTWKSQIRN